MRDRTLSPAGILAIGILSLAVPAEAIIIRHDKGYDEYRVREVDFPAVFYLEQQANRRICAGTLIDASWAITAAHCVAETGLSATLAEGVPYVVRLAGRERTIDRVVLHPLFVLDAHDEVDLALLRFDAPTGYPVPLALNRGSDEEGRVVDLVGWGYFGLGTTGRQYSDGELRRAQNRIESAGRRLLIRFDDPRQNLDGTLELEGMPALGDSGGPALLAEDDGWVLAGIAVGELQGADFSEEEQGRYGAEAIYERVSAHLEWITDTLAEAMPVSE